MTDKVKKAIEQLERVSNSLASIGETVDYTDIAIQALEQISHLKDRPCEACEFYTEEGCSKWECVFEGSGANDE